MNNNTATTDILTGNKLKLIALVAMTIDHIGAILLPDCIFLRVIGRLAFPIFAFSIAQGCRYTKNRKKYFGKIFLVGLLCQVMYYIADQSLGMCIMITFSLSVLLIYAMDNMLKNRSVGTCFTLVLTFIGIYFVSEILPGELSDVEFFIDYGFWGIITPAIIYHGKTKEQQILLTAVALCLVATTNGILQWYSLFALVPIMMYNGKRGNANIKNLFYIYYPLHLAVIHLISSFI